MKIGAFANPLDLWQAQFIQQRLKDKSIPAEICTLTHPTLDALTSKKVDVVVSPFKNLPSALPPTVMIGGVGYRENPCDAMVMLKETYTTQQLFGLPLHAAVGTSVTRRKNQILALRPDIKIEWAPKVVEEKLSAVRQKKLDAVVIAYAYIERLDLDMDLFHIEKLDPKVIIPSPGQGVIALLCRTGDESVLPAMEAVTDFDALETANLERRILQGLGKKFTGVYGVKAERDDQPIFKVWATYANVPGVSLYLEGRNFAKLADKVMDRLLHVKPRSVFISRDTKVNDFFVNHLEALGFKVFAKSLIEIKQVPIKNIPVTDWIFFSSKNGVKHFFRQCGVLPSTVKFGVVGKATAEELRKQGKKADFMGYSTDTRMTGKQFAAVVGSGCVLFPQAKGSLKTIQQQFTKGVKIIDLPVYETLKPTGEGLGFDPSTMDIVVFTSPSNVEAWFSKYPLNKAQLVVAMGDATAHTLIKEKIIVQAMPPTFDDMGLAQAVLSLN